MPEQGGSDLATTVLSTIGPARSMGDFHQDYNAAVRKSLPYEYKGRWAGYQVNRVHLHLGVKFGSAN